MVLKERDVLIWLAQGKTLPEIAVILDVSATTVRTHYKNARAKLGGNTQAENIVIAITFGLISRSPDDLTP